MGAATIKGQCTICGKLTSRVFYRTGLTEAEEQLAEEGRYVPH